MDRFYTLQEVGAYIVARVRREWRHEVTFTVVPGKRQDRLVLQNLTLGTHTLATADELELGTKKSVFLADEVLSRLQA